MAKVLIGQMLLAVREVRDEWNADLAQRSERGEIEDMAGLSEVANRIHVFEALIKFLELAQRWRDRFYQLAGECMQIEREQANAEADKKAAEDAKRLRDEPSVKDVRNAFPGADISHVDGRRVPAEGAPA